jgi:hypothetical protein
LDEVRDPMLELLRVTGVARVRHFLHDENLHLLLKIERAPELQWFGFSRADPFAEVGEVLPADGKRCARHHATTIVAKDHSPQDWREINRRRVE